MACDDLNNHNLDRCPSTLLIMDDDVNCDMYLLA